MTYKEQLKHPRWQKKRLEIMQRDEWACTVCANEENTLHVHHKKYKPNKKAWEYPKKDLTTLCEDCHFQIERLKKELDEDIDMDKIDIIYSVNWDNGSKIIYASYKGILSMEIYDKSNKYIIGFNIERTDLFYLKNIANQAYKNGK